MAECQTRTIGKGFKERFVFFAPSTAEPLKRWIPNRREEPGVSFLLSFEGVKMVFNRIKMEAALKVFRPPQLRPTIAINLLAGVADTHSFRGMVGHDSMLTTERGLPMAASDLEANHAAASPYKRVSSRQKRIPVRGRWRLKAS